MPLQVVGQGDATPALVPVVIDGRGPYLFALDTGASSTVVDVDVADEVGLPRTGERRDVTGVIGEQSVPIAAIERWALGDVALDPGEVALRDLPSPEQGRGLRGLLGSDVLSRFDHVVIDYDEQRLGPAP